MLENGSVSTITYKQNSYRALSIASNKWYLGSGGLGEEIVENDTATIGTRAQRVGRKKHFQ